MDWRDWPCRVSNVTPAEWEFRHGLWDRRMEARPRSSSQVVFGTVASVNRVLAATGWQINTAVIERANLTIRQHGAAVGRRVMTLCTHKEGLCQPLAL
jgi:hypothetical protein